jgi:hypothetical protein
LISLCTIKLNEGPWRIAMGFSFFVLAEDFAVPARPVLFWHHDLTGWRRNPNGK